MIVPMTWVSFAPEGDPGTGVFCHRLSSTGAGAAGSRRVNVQFAA